MALTVERIASQTSSVALCQLFSHMKKVSFKELAEYYSRDFGVDISVEDLILIERKII